MAEWNWHVALAREVMSIVGAAHEKDFILGSILPDAPWMTIDDAIHSGARERLHMARMSKSGLCQIADYPMWLEEYVERAKESDLYCGYLTHMVLDTSLNQMWNLLTERVKLTSFCLKGKSEDEILSLDDLAKLKWSDVALYSKETFGLQLKYLPYEACQISKDTLYFLSWSMELPEERIQIMLDKLPGVMRGMIDVDKDSLYLDSKLYDSIHKECVERCVRDISIIRSII